MFDASNGFDFLKILPRMSPGDRVAWTVLVPCIATGTPFQEQVWNALRTIPFGSVASYRDVAERIGNPRSVRAVGAANGANPIPIILPCHRVVGSDGSLTGFGGGVERKQWLLAHEGAFPASLGDVRRGEPHVPS